MNAPDPLQDLRQTTEKLERAEMFFEAYIHQSPYVMWCKDYSDGFGRMVFISHSASKYFGVENGAWEGATDEQVFGREIGLRLRKHDLIVLATGRPTTTREFVPGAQMDEWRRCIAYRWPIYDVDGNVQGVGGILWPAGDTETDG